ncbi:MAG: crosslink repair DNA glycosylase YcaQ family protein [Cytophagales bacterium]|nr:crosslink repair DNA glycosylase YcaQ family protein [Cytophagales bacterium]
MPDLKTSLSLAEARKVILANQGLKHPSTTGQSAKRLALEAIEKVGYVQIDTISVVQRAHHHVFQSRVPHYQPAVLEKLESDRSIFEYWSHAASYLPMSDYRYSLPLKLEIQGKEKFWFKKDHQLMQNILDRMKMEGPLRSRDFEAEKKDRAMWETHPAKQALQNLFMEGKIMVKSREGFQKVYDLTERVIPSSIDTSTPTEDEYIQYLIKRDIKAHGLVALDDIGYLLKGLKPKIKGQIEALEAKAEIFSIQIGKLDRPFYTSTESLEVLNQRYGQRLKFLNPFDNALINRARTTRLFNFDFIIEIYVPAEKRKFGYYALPVLWKDRLVGQVDMKADRKTKQLLIRNLELNIDLNDAFLAAWQQAIREFSAFQGTQEVVFEEKAQVGYQAVMEASRV